ncbi:MAG: hypothetical protein A2017_18655 [Lentisphaerae bacterium GWF2_44_16]|nr:MAG: hypothetical protein A2017_18655 [Lentisphaerae bacterium GWF2_44_16]
MKKTGEKIFYSTLGVIIVLVIIIAVNVIASSLYFRWDFSSGRMYTLSGNSRKIVDKLESPVTIRFYCTQSNNRMPVYFRNYAKRIEDLLTEYKNAGGKKIKIVKYDPIPDSDAEDAAALDGVTGQLLNTGDKIYMGVAVSSLDKTITLPFLAPQKENILEYEITRAISQVIRMGKDKIGVMSPFPVLGAQATATMLRSGKFRPEGPWFSFRELKEDFDLVNIPFETETVDKNLKMLIIVHPSGISDKTQFAIDQYLLRGGKLIVFLDPRSFYAAIKSQEDKSFYKLMSSDMDKLLKAWGISYNPNIVLADMTFAKRIQMPDKLITFGTVLDIIAPGFNKTEIITGQLDRVSMFFPGYFDSKPLEGLKRTVLINSTKDAQGVSSFIADKPEVVFRNFNPVNKNFDLALSLAGRFRTAFPDGRPGEPVKDEKDGKTVPKNEKILKESVRDGTVFLVADSDILVNDACVQPTKTSIGQSVYVRVNDNINFLQNIVEYLCGDSDMTGIRCRQIIPRPFTAVMKIRSQAERRYKDKILEIERDLKTTQEALNRLQKEKGTDQQFVLSPQQQEELKKFKAKEAEAKLELKKLRKQLRRDIDFLENTLKWVNIVMMPLIVALFGIGLAIYKRRRTSAK